MYKAIPSHPCLGALPSSASEQDQTWSIADFAAALNPAAHLKTSIFPLYLMPMQIGQAWFMSQL